MNFWATVLFGNLRCRLGVHFRPSALAGIGSPWQKEKADDAHAYCLLHRVGLSR